MGRTWRDLFDSVLFVIAVYAFVNLTTVRFVVDGGSMQPTFDHGQLLVVSRLNYLFDEPQQGDIIVFHFPRNTQQDYIKRVIGLPGDVVAIRDTVLYVNGTPLQETYLLDAQCTPHRCDDRMWQLGHDEYFVMGDNRNHSSDSRVFGPINRQNVVGEVVLRYWPVNQIGFIR